VDREEAVFNAVLELPAEFRAGYLRTACGGDRQFYSQIEALFRALGQPLGPMEAASRCGWVNEKLQPAEARHASGV
jgi:hypothetical protein